MAKASSLAQNLVKELECAVCLEQYKEPKVLPCLHSYCKNCLEGLLTKQGVVWNINCPSCRISVEIPKGEVDSLPVNFFLNNLLSMVSLHGDSGSSTLECDYCDSGDPPISRCASCCHFLCEFCTAGHKRGRSTKIHRLISLEEAKEEGPASVTRPSLCKEHDGEILKLFCETCDEAICRDCTIVKHREHKYTFVKDAFSKGKESVLKILSETKSKASVLQEALDGVAEVKRSVQSNAERTVKEVFDCFQELTACLNTRCNELICSIEELKKAKLKSLEIQQGDLETALGSVQSSIEFTERALEHGSEVDILNMRKQMSCRLQELNSARWQLEPSAHDHFKFLPDYQLQQALPSFGDVTDVFTDVITHAGSSTVTMGHGSEGVMYNTLNGQLIEFVITAKDWNGRKQTGGGDVFEVEISTQEGEVVFKNPAVDCGNGTYSFCFTPIHGVMEYHLSVKLSGCHVKGSSFAWFNEIWNLCTVYQYPLGRPSCYVQLTEKNMKATIQQPFQQLIDQSIQQPFQQSFQQGIQQPSQQSFEQGIQQPFKQSFQQGIQQPLPYQQGIQQPLPYQQGIQQPFQQPFQQGIQQPFQQSFQQGIQQPFQQPFQQGIHDQQPFHQSFQQGSQQPFQQLIGQGIQQPFQQGIRQRFQQPFEVSYPAFKPPTINLLSDSKRIVFGSSHFGSGKHSWKVCISGNFTAGFAFGVGASLQDLHSGKSQWTWSSGNKYEPTLPLQKSTITNCMNNDVIEFYLDCDNEILMMYNQRTRQLDTWRRIQGEVHPIFELYRIGDQVTLPCQPNSSQNETFAACKSQRFL